MFVRETFLMELFQTLKVLNVTLVAIFIPESRLSIDGGVCHKTLTENSWIGLRQVLGALHSSMPF